MIDHNLAQLREDIAEECGRAQPTIILVSKFISCDAIMQAYAAGARVFGENRVQELVEKIDSLPDDIEWHFIGHLQTNKAKDIVGKVALIHSVDSEKLAYTINNEAAKHGIIQDCLLQTGV